MYYTYAFIGRLAHQFILGVFSPAFSDTAETWIVWGDLFRAGIVYRMMTEVL